MPRHLRRAFALVILGGGLGNRSLAENSRTWDDVRALHAQESYRDIQPDYRILIGSYLAAANQLNLAVGREVIP